MSKPLFIFILFFSSLFASAQHLVSAEYTGTTYAATLASFSTEVEYDVDFYKVTYNTTNIDGSSTVASGAMAVPKQTGCNTFPMAVYEHGTILRKSDVPSNENFEANVPKVLASTGAVAVAPDYLGLGINPGLHPYLHGESEATATLDLLRAAREFLEDSLQLSHNGEVYVTGYSQGGHAAMATAKYVEENSLLNEFSIIGAGPASGPYHLSGTQAAALMSGVPYSSPGYVIYLFFAMERVYGNVFDSPSDILKPPYDAMIPPLMDGNYSMATLNSLLPNTISDFIQDSVLNNFQNDSVNRTHPVWQFLLANDNHDWSPSFPIEMYYCTQDEQVAFQNALDAEVAMQARGANVSAIMKGPFDHSGCFMPSMQDALDMFLDLRTDCTLMSNDELDEGMQLSLYPNPAKDKLHVGGWEEEASITIRDISGKTIFKKELKEGQSIDVSNWGSGLYVIVIQSKGRRVAQKLVIEH